MAKERKNPARYVSDGEINAIRRGISREMFESFEVVWMTVMRDKFGFGADRLGQVMIDTHGVGEAFIDEKISLESMQADLARLRGIRVTEPEFIRRPMSSGDVYWTAKDLEEKGGRTWRESELRNLRLHTERYTWLSCECIWLYTLQLPRRRDPFGTDRLRRAQTEARALGAEIHDRRVSIADLKDVLREEAHIVLQRPKPREAEVGGKAPFTMPETAGGQCPPLR